MRYILDLIMRLWYSSFDEHSEKREEPELIHLFKETKDNPSQEADPE